MNLAMSSLFLNVANILAVFDISKPVDELGNEREIEEVWLYGQTRSVPTLLLPVLATAIECADVFLLLKGI